MKYFEYNLKKGLMGEIDPPPHLHPTPQLFLIYFSSGLTGVRLK